MKLKIYEHSANYTATVISLPVKQKVEGLDNLVKVDIFGNSCLINKDENEDQLFLFFPAECELSHIFLSKNNLYKDPLLNEDPNKKSFFEINKRVKALKFKGVISTGFVIPLSSLKNVYTDIMDKDWFSSERFKVGDEFNEIDGIEICRKYVPKNLNLPGQPGSGLSKQDKIAKKFDKLIPNQFRLHESTSHLSKNTHMFNLDDIILISNKKHGTSAVFSNILIKKQLKWYERILLKWGLKLETTENGNIYSSRTVVKNKYINLDQGNGFYGKDNDIWSIVNEEIKDKIEPGLTLYGEIIGFLPSGGWIQGQYDYGCKPTEHKFEVYRITYTKPDGNVIEFTWNQIREYCFKYELNTVEEFYFGTLKQWMMENYPEFPDDSTPPIDNFGDAFFEKLQSSYNLEKIDKDCVNKVYAEGVVVRIDGKSSFSAYKLKSKLFLNHETKELDSGVENIEDQN